MTCHKVHLQIFKEIISQYIFIWVSFVVAIALSIWSLTPSFYIPISFSSEVCETINTLLSGLSLSYVAGVIFFVFSVVLPEFHRAKNVLPNLASLISALEEEILLFPMPPELKATNESWNYNGKNFLQSLVQNIDVENINIGIITPEDGDVVVKYNFTTLFSLRLRVQNIDTDLSELQHYSQFLSPQDYYVLSEIRHCSLFNEIRHRLFVFQTETYSNIDVRLAIVKGHINRYAALRRKIKSMADRYDKYLVEHPSRFFDDK